MSYNHENPEKAARKHKPALIAIALALLVAAVVFFVFTPGADEQNDGIATTPPPAGTPVTDAEGLGEDVGAPTTPGAETPADGATGPVGTAARPAGEDAPAEAPAPAD